MKVSTELSVCGNCLCIVANDDWTGCADVNEETVIREAMSQYGYLCVSCDDDCEGSFTWSPCDLCGATGRDDHRVINLERTNHHGK